ncbi:MAG TPA: NAD(P)-dependent oxidoreductase [Tepidisphaeraceae bacterium]|nr:NAD(P)-dependent oxidoreductase [Tepidisphaeraceae bacterium]
MPQSFTIRRDRLPDRLFGKRSVLVTGAAGNIGLYFAEHSSSRYALRLMVHQEGEIEKLKKWGEVVVADLSDIERLQQHCQGIDTVVHLAADPSPKAEWESLLPANIVGTYNMMMAALQAGCRRVIYASSIHAVMGNPVDVQSRTSDPVNPGDLYGVTKCFGEALGRYLAGQKGLSVIALRIGAFQPIEAAQRPEGLSMLDIFVSQRDLNQLIEKCIDDPMLQWAIFNGLSDNRFKRLDISDARELVGYAPQDDLTQENLLIKSLHLKETVNSR